MALAHFQRTFTDNEGNIQTSLAVTVRNESDNSVASIFEDKAGGTPKSNPFNTDSFGYGNFYAKDGKYRIQATDIDWRDVELVSERVFNVSSVAEVESVPPVSGRQVSLSGELAGDYEFDSSDLSTEIDNNPEPGFYVTPASDPTGASGAWVRQKPDRVKGPSSLSPVFIEQFINGFGGRGMLAAETPNVSTEQAITSSSSSGSTTFGVASTSDLDVGGRVTVYHDTVDLYETYFINSLSATSIGIDPGLKYPVTTNSKVERTWWNQPHPGKFYMRYLAQRIARGREFDNAAPGNGRLYFSQLDSNPTNANDQATSINGASLSYVDEQNVSQGLISKPLESSIGRALFITVNADGEGAYLPEFNTYGVTDAIISCVIMSRIETVDVVIQVRDTDGFLQAKIPVPSETLAVATKHNFPVKLPARTDKVRLEVVADSGVTGSTSIILDQIEVYAAQTNGNAPIPKDERYTIVALGDSWIAGDLVTTTEREPITQQLAKELPLSRIINSGVGGEKVQDLLARFDTDVAPYNPDYVIINTGTNDAYNPASGTFDPNSIDFFEYTYNQLLARVLEIGARPIIIGVPALAEEDGANTGWLLNDRAKAYSRYFWKRFSDVPTYLDPRVEDATLLSWTPSLKIDGVTTGITYSEQTGSYVRQGNVVHFDMQITLTSKGVETGFVTISLPPVTPNGTLAPIPLFYLNVSSATGLVAIPSISGVNEMRLHIPGPLSLAAATEANLTDTTRLELVGSYLV